MQVIGSQIIGPAGKEKPLLPAFLLLLLSFNAALAQEPASKSRELASILSGILCV